MLYNKITIMSKLRNGFIALILPLFLLSCNDQGGQRAESTPIDSTNLHGTAPATYGGDDPAMNANDNPNRSDTGTDAGNVSNNGNPENGVKPR